MTSFFFILTFFATFLTISSSNPVYAVLGLISLFTFTSSYLLLLGLGFIAISYLLIYVGAIAILFLFVVMMMNLKFLTYHLLPNFLPLATVITIFFFFSNFSFFFLFDSFNFFFFSPLNYPWSCLFNSSHHLTSLAYPLYSSFSLWLLFSSLLLLLAMIAPIILILTYSQHNLSSCKTSIPASSSNRLTPGLINVRLMTTSSKYSVGSSHNKLSTKQFIREKRTFYIYTFLILIGFIFIFLFPSIVSVLPFDWSKNTLTGLFDVVMCADIPGSEEPLDTEHANTYEHMPKDEMIETVKTITNNGNTALVGIGIATGFKAISDGVSGDVPNAVTFGTISTACVIAGGLVTIAGDEICRKIENIPDNHPPDRAPSPSVYGSDCFRSPLEPTFWENIKEYFYTLAEKIFKSLNPTGDIIPFLNERLEYISTLENETKVIVSIILLVIFAIYFLIIKKFKNYISKKINHFPFKNKYLKLFIQYKNFMNKISNNFLNFMIGFCLTFALFGVLMLIFLF